MPEYRYFTLDEFACKCGCGTNEIDPDFVADLDELRHRCGFPFVLRSAYRCSNHPDEAKKENGPGAHNNDKAGGGKGVAVDIAVNGGHQRWLILSHAAKMYFTGLGVHSTFIHVDKRQSQGSAWPY